MAKAYLVKRSGENENSYTHITMWGKKLITGNSFLSQLGGVEMLIRNWDVYLLSVHPAI